MPRRQRKLIFILVVSCAMLLGTMPARSQFAVIDVAAIAQAVLDYTEQLAHYVELVNQYEQMLTDYALQVENLEGYLDPDELRALLGESVAAYYGVSPLYDIFSDPPKSLEEALEVLAEVYALPPSEETLDGDYADIFDGASYERVREGVSQDWLRVERVASTIETIAENRRIAEVRQEQITEYGDRISEFAPNSMAESSQLTAAELNLLLFQMEQLLVSVDEMVIRQENEERERIDGRGRAREARLESIKAARNTDLGESDISDWYFR